MDIEYFMDKCTDYEVNNIIENLSWTDRNLWESQRLNAYITSKANFKGVKKMSDVCKLPWDNMDSNEDKEITKEQIQELKDFAKKNLGGVWQS